MNVAFKADLDGNVIDEIIERDAPLANLFETLLRRWRLIAGTAFVCFTVILVWTLLSPRLYTATALIMVNPGRDQVLSDEQMIDTAAPNSAAVDSELEILRSPVFTTRLVRELNLQRDPEWNTHLRGSALSDALSPQRAEIAGAAGARPTDEAEIGRIAKRVSAALTVRRRGSSYGIAVSMDSRSPRRAAQLTNALVQIYLESQSEGRYASVQRANSWLSTRLYELRQDVRAKEQAAEAFRVAHGLAQAAGDGDGDAPQSDEVQSMLLETRADLAEKEARLRQVQRLLASGGSADSIANTLSSPVIGELRSREATLAQRVAELRQRYSAEHPDVLAAETELSDARQRIREETQRITQSLRNEVDVARARLNTLQGSFGAATGALDENNEAVIQYRELLRDATAARSVEESFLLRYQEVANQGALPVSTSRLVSPATRPTEPSKPNIQSSLVIAVLMAALLGAGVALLAEALDTSVSRTEDVQRKLGVRALASIPLIGAQQQSDLDVQASAGGPYWARQVSRLRGEVRKATRRRRAPKGQAKENSGSKDSEEPSDYILQRPASAFAEAIRVLRTTVVHSFIARKHRVFAVASAVPGEGKTTIALCLARISALTGQRVVLVDCDLRRRTLSESFRGDGKRGLLEVLSGQVGWRDALVRDEKTGLDIIPVVSAEVNFEEVFSSKAMTDLVETLRGNYDLVILDSAPILVIAESRTVTALADATIFVVRSEKTPASAVRLALKEIEHAGGAVGGVALNCVDVHAAGRNYYKYSTNYYQQ